MPKRYADPKSISYIPIRKDALLPDIKSFLYNYTLSGSLYPYHHFTKFTQNREEAAVNDKIAKFDNILGSQSTEEASQGLMNLMGDDARQNDDTSADLRKRAQKDNLPIQSKQNFHQEFIDALEELEKLEKLEKLKTKDSNNDEHS